MKRNNQLLVFLILVVFNKCIKLHSKKKSKKASSSSSEKSRNYLDNKKVSNQNLIRSGSVKKYLQWPAQMDEKVAQSSGGNACGDTKSCRPWSEQKNVAFCKSSQLVFKMQEMYPDQVQDRNLYFVKTLLKSEEKTGWSNFLFVHISQNNLTGQIQQSAKFIKICVPVDVTLNAWIDDICPLDACGPMPQDQKKCVNSVDPNQQL